MAKRELSCFIAQELLYEYHGKYLDDRRMQAVQRHLKECNKCQQINNELKLTLQYFQDMTSLEIAPARLSDLQMASRPLLERIRSWDWENKIPQWRWTVATLLVVIVAGSLVRIFRDQIPFLKTVSDTATLAEGEYPEGATSFPEQVSGAFQGELAESEGEIAMEEADGPDIPLREETVAPPVVVAPVSKEAAPAPIPTPVQGLVYRMYMFSGNVPQITPEVIAKINVLGGIKAGDVPLGWARPNGSYFHFTMPEKAYNELVEFLKAKEQVRVDKDVHSRVMPKGMVRTILWIEHKEEPGGAPTPPTSVPTEPAETTGTAVSPEQTTAPEQDAPEEQTDPERADP